LVETELTTVKKEDLGSTSSSARRKNILRLALVLAAALASWLGLWKVLFPFDLIAIAATILGGYPVYKETAQSLSHGRVNMEVSMAVAIVASLLLGQYTVAVVITFFVLLSEFIEEYAEDRGRQTITLLENSIPKKALVRREGKEIEIGPNSLQRGDVVIVRDGDRIPIDGTIAIGSAFVNQSAITGESERLEKEPGDLVYAGSINESGVIEVRTEKVGTETIFGKIIKLVEEAENKKAPIQKISDKLAAWLVEIALAFSAITFLLTRNLTSTLSVIVVAGACGVAAGTPLAIVAIMGKAAKKGTIVKGGAYVEELHKIDTIVLDKTGTLTFGEPSVSDIRSFNGYSESQVMYYAWMAERHSNHPLAKAIIAKARELGIDEHPSEKDSGSPTYFPGKGVMLEYDGSKLLVGNQALMREQSVLIPGMTLQSSDSRSASFVLVAHAGSFCGVISISDKIRNESKIAINELRKMGLRTIMLTGDNELVAKTVASQVGIDEVLFELLPEDKVSFVEKLVAEGRHVAMVGDGINDAPALARASVGIGMGAGTDVAIEEADVVLMTNDLQRIADVIRLSKKAYRTIMTNFYGTISVDGVGLALAFLGLLNPLLAAGIHVSSELVFILNSARLIR
jgi:heavy metal translocating P-type ATPase